ncbi:MAG: metallophosphoesterase [Verrucomicrobiota bacterium JB022]|nr:metallophosphoesterase [Verrucomicrobiota bacterium JB022]
MAIGRLITIGDVHGCAEQLAELLAWLRPGADDRVIFVGDLVNKGPKSAWVIDMALELKAECVLGNHELRLLRFRESGDPTALKDYDRVTLRQLKPHHWDYMAQMPLTLTEPAFNSIIVHGGFLPQPHWTQQGADIVTKIQVIDHDGRPAKRQECPRGHAWANEWTGPEFVIYGHTPRPAPLVKCGSICIDTGAVTGGRLTAFVWPEGAVYQVRDHRHFHHQYFPEHPAEKPAPALSIVGAGIKPPRTS